MPCSLKQGPGFRQQTICTSLLMAYSSLYWSKSCMVPPHTTQKQSGIKMPSPKRPQRVGHKAQGLDFLSRTLSNSLRSQDGSSQNRGPQYRPPNYIILITGSPQKVPNLGNLPYIGVFINFKPSTLNPRLKGPLQKVPIISGNPKQ